MTKIAIETEVTEIGEIVTERSQRTQIVIEMREKTETTKTEKRDIEMIRIVIGTGNERTIKEIVTEKSVIRMVIGNIEMREETGKGVTVMRKIVTKEMMTKSVEMIAIGGIGMMTRTENVAMRIVIVVIEMTKIEEKTEIVRKIEIKIVRGDIRMIVVGSLEMITKMTGKGVIGMTRIGIVGIAMRTVIKNIAMIEISVTEMMREIEITVSEMIRTGGMMEIEGEDMKMISGERKELRKRRVQVETLIEISDTEMIETKRSIVRGEMRRSLSGGERKKIRIAPLDNLMR